MQQGLGGAGRGLHGGRSALHQPAGRSNSLQRLEDAQRYYTEGMAFCEQRELRYFTRCLRGGQADTLLALGRWDEAAELCARCWRFRASAGEPAVPAARPGRHPRPPRRGRRPGTA